MIRIHNSLTGEKQELRPITPGQIRMYTCGVTVYDYFHVGNARMLVVFDMVNRYLRHRGFDVTYVRNITDVDDKIINRAREAGVDWLAHARTYTDAMHEDLDKLGCLRPTKEPKASEYIDEMLTMIGQLIEKGFAYQATNGDVMYDVRKFGPYGKLSGRKLDDLRAGARVEVDEAKRDPLDFVLWKTAKPGEPAWPSKWGNGRPGWHIECSAMSTKELGEHFDIHGGGLDLKFPHHENEIAQTCGATGGKFAEIWMHNGFLNIDNEKMSKSLGNFFTTREVMAKIKHPEVLRLFLLSSHYRGPINYSPTLLDEANKKRERLYSALRGVRLDGKVVGSEATEAFQRAMDDDFNTPQAISVLFELATQVNRAKDANDLSTASQLSIELLYLARVLGLLVEDPLEHDRAVPPPRMFVANQPQDSAAYEQGGSSKIWSSVPSSSQSRVIHRVISDAISLSDEAVAAKIEERTAARKAKDWAGSDRIRDQLAAAGVILEDKPGGVTTWRRG